MGLYLMCAKKTHPRKLIPVTVIQKINNKLIPVTIMLKKLIPVTIMCRKLRYCIMQKSNH